MKIVYVYPHFVDRAGTERVLIDKMNYLAIVYGYDVFMLTNEQGNHALSFPIDHRVNHIDLDVRFSPLYKKNRFIRYFLWKKSNRELKRRYNAFVNRIKPDIVISTTYHSNWVKIVGECSCKYIRVLESHIDKRYILNHDPINRKSLLRWLHTLSQMKTLNRESQKFDLLVALVKEDADDWSKYVRTMIIPNVVNLNLTGRYSKLEEKKVIFVGRYTEQKGIMDLFEIWKLVYPKHQDWSLELYGDGHLRDELITKANVLQMNIHVHESVDNIFERYLECSIFVLTSLYEPFGLVMPEAMSCGLPVVAFDCPLGPAGIISDGETGFLIPDRDKKLFSEKVCNLMDSFSLRHKMGSSAIISAQRFSADLIMPYWKNVFEKLVNSHAAQ